MTQRPQKVHENVLSQCDNLVLMRMNSAADLAHVGGVFSFVPPGLIDRATTFRQGEALVAGKIASHPALIRFGARITRGGRRGRRGLVLVERLLHGVLQLPDAEGALDAGGDLALLVDREDPRLGGQAPRGDLRPRPLSISLSL